MKKIASFVKYHRKRLSLTQEELAHKSGIGIRFIRELEQGKQTLRLDKVDQVLSLFGYGVSPKKLHIDPYFVFFNCFNQAIKISLQNKTIKYGVIIEELFAPNGNDIFAWKFIPNNHVIKYQQHKEEKLTETILHADIQTIEEQ